MSKKLRLGLLLDSYDEPAWIFEMLERIQQSDYGRIRLVILNGTGKQRSSPLSGIIGASNRLLYEAFCRFENTVHRPSPNALECRDTRVLLARIPAIAVKPRLEGSSYCLEDEDVEKIKDYRIDIIIQLGFGTLVGEVLDCSRFGVWSYFFGDDRLTRDGPPGFWEVLEGHPVTISALQVLTRDSSTSIVLFRSYSSTNPVSMNWNLNNCYWKSLSFLPRKLRELRRLGKERFLTGTARERRHPSIHSIDSHDMPTNIEMLKILPGHLLRNLRRRAVNAFSFEHWFLMYDLRSDMSTSFREFKKIMPPLDRYWADPCIVREDDSFYLFLEEFPYRDRKGHISVIEIDTEGNWQKPKPVLERPYHLSYPFVFEWEGDFYMIPESIENRTIEVFKCLRFPYQWVFLKNLMKDVLAVDTTLFCHNETWWLFSNLVENVGASDCDELFLFCSDSPLSDSWNPHPRNPIISDVRRSRPAGKVFERSGAVYRPSQDCSRRYGYGVRLNQIITLNEKAYEEEEVMFIEPNWDEKIEAVHTFGYGNGLTIIDAMIRRFGKRTVTAAHSTPHGRKPQDL